MRLLKVLPLPPSTGSNSYVTHSIQVLFTQRSYQIACAYEDGNDANALRSDPVFKLGLDRKPLDEGNDLASAPTFSRLENAATPKHLVRMAQALVDQFIASYPKPPQSTWTIPRMPAIASRNSCFTTPTAAATATCRWV